MGWDVVSDVALVGPIRIAIEPVLPAWGRWPG